MAWKTGIVWFNYWSKIWKVRIELYQKAMARVCTTIDVKFLGILPGKFNCEVQIVRI